MCASIKTLSLRAVVASYVTGHATRHEQVGQNLDYRLRRDAAGPFPFPQWVSCVLSLEFDGLFLLSRRSELETRPCGEFADVFVASSRSAWASGTSPFFRGNVGLDRLCHAARRAWLFCYHPMGSSSKCRDVASLGLYPSSSQVGSVSQIADGAFANAFRASARGLDRVLPRRIQRPTGVGGGGDRWQDSVWHASAT